mmetsp:Transcript_50122/g.108903  ORF Transcript_50122/g.108903 Transcript_50122/m.108903 type:complete len:367 (+) Transcript_50122:85-1185(+)
MAMLSFMTFLLLAGHSASASASECPSLMLLQVNAQKLHGERRNDDFTLPEVHELLSSSNEAAKEFSAKVSELEQQLLELQRERLGGLTNRRNIYEKNLTALQGQLSSTESLNMATAKTIDSLERESSELLQKAQSLSKENDLLREDLRDLQMNVSTAEEFIDRALDASDDSEREELDVLRKLERREEGRTALSEHQQRMEEIAGATGISLLAVHAAARAQPPSEQDTMGTVETLKASFDRLQKEQLESIAEMKRLFLEEQSKSSERLAELLRVQGGLNTTRNKAQQLHSDLRKAVEHLQAVHESLESQATKLRLFIGSLSRRPLPVVVTDADPAVTSLLGSSEPLLEGSLDASLHEGDLNDAHLLG